jgi:renalase
MHVVRVGSGMSGLTAARRILQQGHTVCVLDKGRDPGGRLATRRLTGGSTADHGAQFFTARSEAFNAQTEQWIGTGIVRRGWDGGAGEGHDDRDRCQAVSPR